MPGAMQEPEITRRRVQLDYTAGNAAAWTSMSRTVEDAINAVSFLFPIGETFFVRSVKHYLPRITDPVLRDQAERFIFQEAMHSKEHSRFNLALKQANAFGAELERLAALLLGLARRLLPRATQLAVTCALEHFTAMMADLFLDHPELWANTPEDIVRLWQWHSMEETEHKAVAFDVFLAVTKDWTPKQRFALRRRVMLLS